MPQSVETPHRIATRVGDVFISHEKFIDHLYSCAEAWETIGEKAQANLIRKQILRVKRLGEKRCPVCTAARRAVAV